MKSLVQVGKVTMVALIVILTLITLTSLSKTTLDNPYEVGASTIKAEGHTWIIFTSSRTQGFQVKHHPDCPCRRK